MLLHFVMMRLSTNFVGWKSGSQTSHYQWLRVIFSLRATMLINLNLNLRVISCTFRCRVLLCSTKHLLVRWDVIATTDIHVHFFGVTFTVTASSQEQERQVRISATHAHWLPSGTSVQKRVLAACIIPTLSCLNVLRNLSWRRNFFSYFSHIVIQFVFRLRLRLFYMHMCAFVTTCLCAFIRLFCAFSSVKNMRFALS